MNDGAVAGEREYVREGSEPAGVRQRFVESRQCLLVALRERERGAGVIEERGSVDRLGKQPRRVVERTEREACDRLRRLVRHHSRDRQHAEHARRDIWLLLGEPAEAGDPWCGFVRGLGVELGHAQGGALERQGRTSFGAAEAGAPAVEHL